MELSKQRLNFFAQEYTMHCVDVLILNRMAIFSLPLCTITNEIETEYTRMWERIKIICPITSPTGMIMDFEKAAINVFQMELPTTALKGCFFHFAQSVWRNIQELRLQTDYISDEQLAFV